ncbi:O-antigen ligase domain-containing protein [Micromonospora sp. NPDC049559]|uniref:O-antigen ligase domain-containing protein n=1 Tax=Micromonospora sp. NPDC049559 TaxID=3155923 RepID=UPI00344328A0
MFGLVPLWWLLGAFYLVWPLFGALLLAFLLRRGRVVLPAGAAGWLLFLCLVLLSATQLERGTAWLTFALRLSFYLTALVVCVYVYTALREQTPWRRVFLPLCLFWLALVVLGWVGVLLPRLAGVTATERLLPDLLAQAPFINDMVHLHASEFNARSAQPIYRPSAPFPYTNNWGSAYAMLVPCVVAYLLSVRTGRWRPVLMVSLPLSLPPAFLTLNRGMFVSLGAGLALLAVRALLRGNVRVVAGVAVLAGSVWLATLVIPVADLIAERTSRSGTTLDRAGLYLEVLRQVRRSPLLGHGAPVAVDTTTSSAPVGTQGQFWLVLFSHGIPALLCFLCWFAVVTWHATRAVSPAGQWLAVVPVVALVQSPFYGLTFQNLTVLFFAAGLALAAVDGPVRRTPAGARAPVRRTPAGAGGRGGPWPA